MSFNNLCSYSTINQMLPRHIWESQVYDRIISPFEIRLFHNKILFTLGDSVSCYLSYYSPDFLLKQFTLLGLILFTVGLFSLTKNKKILVLTLLLVIPLIYFPLGMIVDIIVMFVGLYYLVRLIKK
jgi:hypothetical protein